MQRRNYLKVLGGIGATVGLGGLGAIEMTGGASAKIGGFSMDSKSITTDNGNISDIQVRTKGNWKYDGIDVPNGHSLAGVRIGLNVHKPHSAHAQGCNVATQWIPIKDGR